MRKAAAPSRLVIRPATAAASSPGRGNSFRLIVKVSIGGRHFHGAVTPRHFYVAVAAASCGLKVAGATNPAGHGRRHCERSDGPAVGLPAATGLARLPEDDTDTVCLAVARQGDAAARDGEGSAVDFYARDAPGHPVRILDPDLVARRVVPERDLEVIPRARDAGIEMEDRPA